MDGGEPGPAAQGRWPSSGKASRERAGAGVGEGVGGAAGRAGTLSVSDFDLLGKLGGMVTRGWL